MTTIRDDFLAALRVGRGVLAAPEVETAWDLPSALDLMTVRGLAGHLTRAVTSVNAYLDRDAPPAGSVLLDAPGYLMSIDGLSEDITSELHAAIRARGEQAAFGSHADLVGLWDTEVKRLGERLWSEPGDRALPALDGRQMLLDEYLVTRAVELVVHADDLAASVGVDPPAFDRSVTEPVIGCLVEVARRRHGDLSVVVSMTRRERDRVGAMRVL